MDLVEIGWGCGLDSPDSGQGYMVGSCVCGEEFSVSGAKELVC
jgi:hypothetical protein